MCAFLTVSSPASCNCAAVTHILMGKQILMCFCDNRSHYTLPVLTDFDCQQFVWYVTRTKMQEINTCKHLAAAQRICSHFCCTVEYKLVGRNRIKYAVKGS